MYEEDISLKLGDMTHYLSFLANGSSLLHFFIDLHKAFDSRSSDYSKMTVEP